MENSDKSCHLVSSLPEIIHKIMEFLPNPDLESASLVNPTWEEEALKDLVVRNPVDIHLRNVTDPTDFLLPLRNLTPSYIRIFSHEVLNNMDDLLDLFNSTKFKTVTKLYLNFPLENNLRHVARNLIRILGNESFQNLKSLELQPIMANYQETFSSDVKWKDLFPENVSYPGKKLANLSIDMGFLNMRFFSVKKLYKIVSLSTRILAFFRNVATLKLSGVPGGIFARTSVNFPNLRAVSIKKYRGLQYQDEENDKIMKLYRFDVPLNSKFENVTRYEFNVLSFDSVDQFELFRLLAPQLEQVCISSVTNCAPQKLSAHVVPILPRLKVFEVSRDQRMSYRGRSPGESWFRPQLCLDFESGDGYSVKLVYARQFPVLEKLRVHVAPEWFGSKKYPGEEKLEFEATILFLYENFLAEGMEPCETVRNLDISFPPGGKVGSMLMTRRCGCEEEVNCQCWGWKEEITDFYERIATIFPNLGYDVVERGRKNVRAARIQKIKEMGMKWGIFRGDQDFEKILGFDKAD